MIGGGPFRDTVSAMIANARDELAKLRDERARLQARYEEARAALDRKVVPADVTKPEMDSRLFWSSFKVGLFWGGLIGLLLWLPILGRPR